MLGQALGLTDAEFDALQGDDYRSSPLFNEREKAAMWWAEAMTLNTAKSDNNVWDETRRLFSDAEIVEISLAVGMFVLPLMRVGMMDVSIEFDLRQTVVSGRRQRHASARQRPQQHRREVPDLRAERADSRFASTQPAAPAPTTT